MVRQQPRESAGGEIIMAREDGMPWRGDRASMTLAVEKRTQPRGGTRLCGWMKEEEIREEIRFRVNIKDYIGNLR